MDVAGSDPGIVPNWGGKLAAASGCRRSERGNQLSVIRRRIGFDAGIAGPLNISPNPIVRKASHPQDFQYTPYAACKRAVPRYHCRINVSKELIWQSVWIRARFVGENPYLFAAFIPVIFLYRKLSCKNKKEVIMTDLLSGLSGEDILESVPDAVLVVDRGGYILFGNSRLVNLFGYPRESLCGRHLGQLIPDRFRQLHQSQVSEYVKDPYIRPMGDCSGFYGLHQSGQEFPVEIYLSPLRVDDAVYIMAAVRDVTQRKLLEEELRRSRDELEKRQKQPMAELTDTTRHLTTETEEHVRSEERILELQAELSHVSRLSVIGEMVAGLGHELSQPLAAIQHFAQGCICRLQTAEEINNEDLVDAVQWISKEAARAGEILARFRNFARKEDLQRTWVDIDELVCDAVRLSEFESKRYGVEIDLQHSGRRSQVFVDPIQIQQVIVNLVRNAIESTSDSPEKERRVSIRVSSVDYARIWVSVTDNGHGLLGESVNHLFQPFFTTKEAGLGMGLALSRGIIKAHGGELSAWSNSDRGMTFSFDLPGSGTKPHEL